MIKRYLCKIGDSIYSAKTKSQMNDSRVLLYHSKLDGKWTEKCNGKLAAKLLDDGNGVTVQFKEGPSIRLDYSQVVEMRMLLNLNDQTSNDNGFKLTKFKKIVLTSIKDMLLSK